MREENKKLTKQMEKGDFIYGQLYYVQRDDCKPSIDYGENITGEYYNYLRDYKIKILACVPSYEEWKAINDKCIMFIEHNQRLRRELEEEKAKNRIDYYTGSPMNYLDECERARRKNKIFQNWIKNINEELLTSELRKTKEGNLFIVNLLKKINQVLEENKE